MQVGTLQSPQTRANPQWFQVYPSVKSSQYNNAHAKRTHNFIFQIIKNNAHEYSVSMQTTKITYESIRIRRNLLGNKTNRNFNTRLEALKTSETNSKREERVLFRSGLALINRYLLCLAERLWACNQ